MGEDSAAKIKAARTSLFELQNSYPYGSAQFLRVLRMRAELDCLAMESVSAACASANDPKAR